MRVADAGLTTMALTDHDTLEGIDEARGAARSVGVDFIAGTELSIERVEGSMHLLVYFLEPGPGPLQDRLASLRRARNGRNEQIVERLNGIGIPIRYDDVIAESGGGVVGRPHIAAVLMAMGHVATVKEAFERYLGTGCPGYVGRERLDAKTAIALAHSSGGVPVVAHPHTLAVGADDYAAALRELADLGLSGLEAWYSRYTPDLRQRLADIADELGLVATGGSDHHGRYKPDLDVGVGTGDLRVDDEVAAALHAARP